ncbi:ketopantoate reductase family protein [Thiomonas bhubaneswarensis]|uniref:2-dehydropantoate 2-reductase n=1 Tax=Thiomonas bhubaneswarensis TaxID=339866 RepID=A0A0K6I268_9BURK|nr:2-dehydropantoate 2-reductase [Thiomonas bhubaneswarensis]CUA97230.1 ketopantoate reductase [Thiomonas bhubaneswarensis]
MSAPWKILVVGAGAVGGTLAVRLAAAGNTVGVLARGEHLQAIRRDGLCLEDPHERVCVEVQASDDLADFGPQDLVILGAKAHQLAPLMPGLRSVLHAESIVLPALNGVPWWYFHRDASPHATTASGRTAHLESIDPGGRLLHALDPEHVVGCVVHASAEVVSPGMIRGNGQYRYVIGEPAHERSARVQALAELLREAGCEPEVTDRIRDAIWMKLVGNATFNPVAALTRARMNAICDNPELEALIREGMAEVMGLARAYGCDPLVSIDQRIAIARGIGAVKASTLQDLERGRALEIAALLHAPLELARMAHHPMPTLQLLSALLGELDRQVCGH